MRRLMIALGIMAIFCLALGVVLGFAYLLSLLPLVTALKILGGVMLVVIALVSYIMAREI